MNSNLDVLRAYAVALVVIGHTTAFLGLLDSVRPFRLAALGALGVLLFFVHTSLVLMQSLEREPGAARFYLRRIFRIYPLATTAILAVIVFQIPQASLSVGHFGGYTPDAGDVISNLALVQNFSMRAPVLGPTWSLSYELQMYLLLPLFFVLLTSTGRAVALYFVTAGLALVAHHYTPGVNLLSFAPCFLSGILAYRLGKKASWRLPAWAWPLFLSLLVATYLVSPESPYLNYALCLALGLGISRFEQITFQPLVRAGHYIARYSYGVYLSHLAALYFSFERMADQPAVIRWLVFFALLVALPVVGYHAIEEPFIRIGKRLTRKTSSSPHSRPTDTVPDSQSWFAETTAGPS